MKRSLSLAALLSLTLVACAPRSPESQNQNAKVSESVSREHCIAKDKNASCFLEIETNGSSKFYAPSRDYATLLGNSAVADMNLPMKEIATEDYAKMVNKYGPTTVVYNSGAGAQVEAFANTGLADSPQGAALNGWWEDFGRGFISGVRNVISGAVDGALKGAQVGTAIPVLGTMYGAVGGAILGALNGGVKAFESTNGKVLVNYHFGTELIQAEVPLEQ